MSQTYYFKIPVYLSDGATPRYIVVEFDGAEVANATITSTDVNSPQNIEFVTDKMPGIYTLQVSAPEKVEPWSCVVVDDIWISIDNTNWKSMIVNGIESSHSSDVSYGFSPVKGAHLYGEEETCSWNIPLVDAATWDVRYSSFAERYLNFTEEQIATNFQNDPVLIGKYNVAKAALLARGYN